jgi:uncharacterized membrane protein
MDEKKLTCPICGATVPASLAVIGISDTEFAAFINKRHPEWNPGDPICVPCINQHRAEFVEQLLASDRGELTDLEQEVVDTLAKHDILSQDINKQFERQLTFGERIADKVASFGGSWAFIIIFGVIIVAWITINAAWLMQKPFDPFPFILLNLLLSCTAAMQAPVIMMSQNRQEDRDRLRAESDYKTNLKAELEIRQLHEKMDHLLLRQMRRLMEVQELQIEMLREITSK